MSEARAKAEARKKKILVSTGKHLLKLLKFVGLTNSMHLYHTVKFRLYETKFG